MITDSNLGIYAVKEEQALEDGLDIYFYSNPLNIQANILKTLEDRFKGTRYIADPNNSYMFLIEMFTNIISNNNTDIINKFNLLYPKRALSLTELYPHISDFEYVGIYSTPSNINLELIFDKDYLINNAIGLSNTDYNLIRIPANTVFVIDNLYFGLYYPIDIRINKLTKNFSIVYNTESLNPLYKLNSINILKREYTVNDLNLISLTFPIYQFEKTTIQDNGDSKLGFLRKYIYKDKFYAVRVYTYMNNQWKEINQTLSDFNYDPMTPTAKIKNSIEDNVLTIEVPTIYFEKGLVGNNFKIEIFTTVGELNIDVSELDLTKIKAKFTEDSKETSQYSSILKSIPTIIMRPADSKITGGSNGLSFEDIKNLVLYQFNNVPITKSELDIYFKEYGFDCTLYEDNVTNRIYYASKKIVLPDNTSLNVINSNILINKDTLDNITTIKKHDDQIVILPSTIYKLKQDSNNVTLLEEDEYDNITSKQKNEIVDFLNNSSEKYLFYPYHLVINTKDRYPSAITYDFNDNNFYNLKFLKENKNIASTIDIISGKVIFDEKNEKFIIRIGVIRTGDLKDLDINNDNVKLILKTSTVMDNDIAWLGSYIGTIDDEIDIFDFYIESDFHILDDKISVKNFYKYNTTSVSYEEFIKIDKQRFEIGCFVNYSLYSGVAKSDINELIPPEINNTFSLIGITSSEVTIKLGSKLNDIIFNPLTINWSGDQYERYEYDVYATYTTDVYEKDENGNFVYTIDENNNLILNIIHHQGDQILDEEGNPILLFKAGDIKLDSEGNPIVIENTNKLNYTVEAFLFDYIYKIYSLSNNEYLSSIRDTLKGYYTNVRTIHENILENTKVYFRPYSTIGYCKIKVSPTSNVYQYLFLGLSFNFKYYVEDEVFNDTKLQESLVTKTIEIINNVIQNNEVISISVIIQKIHDNLSQYINSIEINGFNDSELKMIIPIDKNKRFHILSKLEYNTFNESYNVIDDVNIEFINIENMKQ